VDNNLKNIREHLEGECNRLLKELSIGTGQNAVEIYRGNSLGNKEEAAAAYSELEKKSAHIGNLKESLNEVRRALEKVEIGTYGLCDCCGKLIPTARLEAIPQTNFCLDCKVLKNKASVTYRY
jgi:RNA polymerase-binding transcription factor DksA